MRRIFILGVGRTGSKFYMQLLNTHKDIFISPELIYRHPVKNDFYTLLQNSISANNSIETIVDKLFDFKERLPFTKTVTKIGKERLNEALNALKDVTPYAVFDSIIELSASAENKSACGAKFPIHYKYSEELIEFYNNPKILYLTRDPRAIYISDLKKKKKEFKTKHYRFRVKYFKRFFVLFYTIFEWYMSLKVYEKCNKKYSSELIKLMKYENILRNPQSVIKEISEFIEQPENAFSLEEVKIVDSSYAHGLSADRWKKNISAFEKVIFKVLVGRKMRKYGYK